jgi:hypothetical protein
VPQKEIRGHVSKLVKEDACCFPEGFPVSRQILSPPVWSTTFAFAVTVTITGRSQSALNSSLPALEGSACTLLGPGRSFSPRTVLKRGPVSHGSSKEHFHEGGFHKAFVMVEAGWNP